MSSRQLQTLSKNQTELQDRKYKATMA